MEPIEAPASKGKPPAHAHTAELPILAHRQQILDLVASQPVTVVVGATGSGKSSQIPQMLFRDCKERGVTPLILCTQPRRIAAISLAKRVADEMGEALGRTVGYMIGADRVVGRSTSIRFVTTGWAFEKLIHNDSFLEEVSHLVLDEVHERSIDADLLHLLIKLVLPKIPAERRPKVVLMSATFNASVFSRYYAPDNPPEPIFVGVNRYPVETFYLEQFTSCPALRGLGSMARNVEVSEQKRLGVGGQANTVFLSVCRMLHDYHVARNEPCCILVFLSGIAEIDALWEHIEDSEAQAGAMQELSDESLSFEDELADNLPKPGQSAAKTVLSRFQLCMLHSSVEKEDQMTIFSELPAGKTRVILSTNIAESSVTIPNARYVIDAGYHKHMAYDERLGCTSLRTVVISQAAAKQRAGRTGRLFPGTVLRFYSESFAQQMPEYDEPDMLRLPLFNTVLRLKVAAQDDTGFTSPLARPSEALSAAIDPPTRRQIENAYGELFRHGHMISGGTGDLDDSVVTPLGKFLQQLNVDIRLGKLVVTALVLFPDYVPHAIVMAVSMSLQNIFLHANSRTGGTSLSNQASFYELLSSTERKRQNFNGDLFSDALTSLRAFGEQPQGAKGGNWAHRNGLHGTRLHQLHSQSMELAQRLIPLAPAHLAKDLQNLLARNYSFNITPHDATILRFILCYSLSDMLMMGQIASSEKKLGKPENFGFNKRTAPYSDWKKCVFFNGVPMELLEMGGYFERNVCNMLFKGPHRLEPRIHVSEPSMKRGVFEASVSLEFATEEDAVFAQVVLEGCCKNGKMTVWTTEREKVTMPAPVSRQSIKMKVVHTDSGARVGGQSSVNYLTVPGEHFFVPGQTVFVNNSVIVEDVTWLGGSNETDWVWKAVAMASSSHVKSPTSLGIGAQDELYHKYKAPLLKRIVYLKHLCLAAITTQFSPAGRVDLGVEICRSILDISAADLSALRAPRLKSGGNMTANKPQSAAGGKATVIVVSAGAGSEGAQQPADAKLNVVKGLSLRSILAVVASKLLRCQVEQVTVRLARSGRIIGSDAALMDAIEKEGDAVGLLRLEGHRRGTLVMPKVAAAEDFVPARPLEMESGLSRLALATGAPLKDDPEDDAWLVKTMLEVLHINGDGRVLPEQMWGSVKFMAKRPERVTLERLVEVAHTSPHELEYSASRQFFSVARKRGEGKKNGDGDSDDDGSFQFDGAAINVGNLGKAAVPVTSPATAAAAPKWTEVIEKPVEFQSPDKDAKARSKKKKSPASASSARKGKAKGLQPAQLPSESSDVKSVTRQFQFVNLAPK